MRLLQRMRGRERPLRERFPDNPYIGRLLDAADRMGVRLDRSPVRRQWLYHPEDRILYVWIPDLEAESLSFLTVILAHELGHARDFDHHPSHRDAVRSLHWSQVPDSIEREAFLQGFLLLHELQIPLELDAYAAMIHPPMDQQVRRALQDRLCPLQVSPDAALA